MAEVQRYGGLKVPLSDQPLGTQQVQLPPGATLAGVAGQGLQQIGASVDQAANVFQKHAVQMQQMDNKLRADDANSKLSTQWLKDANAPGGFYSLRGQAAYDALPSSLNKLDEMRAQGVDSLDNPEAKALFENDSRRFQTFQASTMASHAAAQRIEWQKSSAQGQIIAAKDGFVAADGNAEQQAGWAAQINNGVDKFAVTVGLAPEEAAALKKQHMGEALVNVATTRALNDPQLAMDYLNQHRGEMPEEMYSKAAHALKPSVEANGVASLVDQAFTTGKITVGVGGTTLDVPALRADPDKYFTNALDVGAVGVSNSDRTPADIARLRAAGYNPSPTSEHNVDASGVGHAVDLIPKAGQTAQQVYDAVKKSGLPFDELYVNTHNNSVHFGYAGTRGIVGYEDAAGNAHHQGQVSFGTQTVAMPTINPETVGADAPKIIAAVRQAAELQFHGDPVMVNRAEEQARQKIGQIGQDYNQGQIAATNTLNGIVVGNPQDPSTMITDQATLLKQPGALAAFNTLSPSRQRTYIAGLRSANQQINSQNLSVYEQLHGTAVNDPAAFAKLDLSTYGLPFKLQKDLVDSQTVIAKNVNDWQTKNTNVTLALKSAPVSQALAAAHIDKGDKEYDQFTGALSDRISSYIQDNKGKMPGDQDLAKMTSELMAKRGNAPTYQVPRADMERITQAFHDKVHREPTPEEAFGQYEWEQKHARH